MATYSKEFDPESVLRRLLEVIQREGVEVLEMQGDTTADFANGTRDGLTLERRFTGRTTYTLEFTTYEEAKNTAHEDDGWRRLP